MSDSVNHPSHYADSCSMECIDVMELVFGKNDLATYCIINAFKYMWRWKNKNGKEDLDKARWYLDKFSCLGCEGDKYDKLSNMLEIFKLEVAIK